MYDALEFEQIKRLLESLKFSIELICKFFFLCFSNKIYFYEGLFYQYKKSVAMGLKEFCVHETTYNDKSKQFTKQFLFL